MKTKSHTNTIAELLVFSCNMFNIENLSYSLKHCAPCYSSLVVLAAF